MPLDVGWLFSRVGKDEVGVGACDGVVCAEPGVEASYEARSVQSRFCVARNHDETRLSVNVPLGSSSSSG